MARTLRKMLAKGARFTGWGEGFQLENSSHLHAIVLEKDQNDDRRDDNLAQNNHGVAQPLQRVPARASVARPSANVVVALRRITTGIRRSCQFCPKNR